MVYFQVVLRKAQHLREHSLEIVKSSVGQDHSYVRSRRAAQRITTRFNGLDVLIKAINYRQSHADILNGKLAYFSSFSHHFQNVIGVL